MIVREAIACVECGHVHVVRIGAGRGKRQLHRFPCRGCGEEICVGLELFPAEGAWRVLLEENAAAAIHPEHGAPMTIVNLEADFLIPADQQGLDGVFPRLEQLHVMAQSQSELLELPPDRIHPGNYDEEWGQLARAWNLTRNKQDVLARARLNAINDSVYAAEPLTGVTDWVFRFSSLLSQPAFDEAVLRAVALVEPLHGPALAPFRSCYDKNMAPVRGARYLRIFREYFENYSEFNQVRLLLSLGMRPTEDLQATSASFRRTSMFYGNAYETLGDLVDLLAMLSNLLRGRAYDRFAQLPSLAEYLKLDKANRFAAFPDIEEFAPFVEERDNRLRNASHHGGITFDPLTSLLTCRAGKGGQGEPFTLTYTDYLTKCVQLFLQILGLYRFELILATQLQVRRPV